MTQFTPLEQLASDILSKQNELKLLREEGSVEVAAQVEREIDELQKSYQRMNNGQPLEEPVKRSYHYEDLKQAVPTLDQQIEFIYAIMKGKLLPDSTSHWHEVYKSLLALKKFGVREAMIEGQIQDALSVPEIVMKSVGRPFDLAAQRLFISLLARQVGSPSGELQRELLNIYTALEATIEGAMWMAECIKERFMLEPGNQPDPNKARSIQEVKAGDLELYIGYDSRTQTHIATFNHWCELGELSGTGATPEAAVIALFSKREQKRQTELFGGGDHE